MYQIRKLLGLPFSYRQRRLGRERKPLDEAAFVHEITGDDGDHAAAILLWKRLQGWVYAENFAPYPSDDLEKVFGIAEEELDEDLILSILQELSVPPPSDEALSRFGRINTPLRVAQLVGRCRGDCGVVSGPKILPTRGKH
jgi:hypothetical protein